MAETLTSNPNDLAHAEALCDILGWAANAGRKSHAIIAAAFASSREEGAREAVTRFADAILHGDDVHRQWLREAAGAFIEGKPMPAPRPARNESPTIPAERARWERERGARILAEARRHYPNDPGYTYVAGQRLAPWPDTPDTFTAERIAGALDAAESAGAWRLPSDPPSAEIGDVWIAYIDDDSGKPETMLEHACAVRDPRLFHNGKITHWMPAHLPRPPVQENE